MPTGCSFPGPPAALLALRTAIHDPPRFFLGRFRADAGTGSEAHEELPVTLRAAQRRFGDREHAEPRGRASRRGGGETAREPYHLDERRQLLGRVPDDAALPDLAPADLELRLHQGHDRGHERSLRARGQEGREHGEHQFQRDEGDVHDDEIERPLEIAGAHPAHVHALDDGHTGIPAQRPVELPPSDVERDPVTRAALQQAVGESPRGRSHVEGACALDVDREALERAIELLAATTDEAGAWRDHELGVGREERAGLVHAPSARADAARENERLGLLARRGEPALDERPVRTGGGAAAADGRGAGPPGRSAASGRSAHRCRRTAYSASAASGAADGPRPSAVRMARALSSSARARERGTPIAAGKVALPAAMSLPADLPSVWDVPSMS